MFCKLLLGVLCISALIHFAEATNVVSFNQDELKITSNKQGQSERLVRQKRSSETDSERNDNKCDSQKQKVDDAVRDKRLETTVRASLQKYSNYAFLSSKCQLHSGIIVRTISAGSWSVNWNDCLVMYWSRLDFRIPWPLVRQWKFRYHGHSIILFSVSTKHWIFSMKVNGWW